MDHHGNGLSPGNNNTGPTANDYAYAAGQWSRTALEQWAIQQLTRSARQPKQAVERHWSDNPVLMSLYCAGCFTVTAVATGIHTYHTARVDVCSQIPPILRPLIRTAPGLPNICGGIDFSQTPTAPSDNITRLRRAIIGQESGGNFKAVNPHSGALGYGQLMPYNVGPWTAEALGKSLTSNEFLNDRDAQIQTIDHKLAEYWEEAAKVAKDEDEIVRRVASKWYSGRSDLWDNTNPQSYAGASYPSIATYTKSVLENFEAE